MEMPRRFEAALAALLVLFSLAGVFDHGLWGTNDTRGAGIVLDMARHGTWVVATINGQDFLDKPPLTYWAALIFAWAFGSVTEGIARFPCALAALGTLLLMRRFVKDPLAAWSGVFLCATTVTFLGYARSVMTDMPLTFCVTLALFLFWRADAASSRSQWRWLPFLLAASLSFFAKAFVGPALIWCAVASYLLVTRRWKLLLGLAAAFLALLAAAVVPWAAALGHARGTEALRYVFWDNQFGRFFSLPRDPGLIYGPLTAHKERWFYYLVNLPAAIGSAVFLLAAALVAWWRPSSVFTGRFSTFIRCAIFGMFFLIQASTSKVAVYALPLFPFFFLATGIWLADFARRERRLGFEKVLAWLFFGTWALVVVGVPAACIALTRLRSELFLPSEGLGPGRFALAGALCLAAVSLAIAVLARRVARGPRALVMPLLPAALAVLLFLDYQLVLPLLERHKTYVPVARWVAAQSGGRELGIGTVQFNAIGAFVFYLDDRHMDVCDGDPSIAAYLSSNVPRAVIVYRRDLPRLAPVLSAVPHEVLECADPGLRSRDFVLLRNSVASR
jgi:4-amino-4-deoxy-L-arabinose transferase-like glycosyltransferase